MSETVFNISLGTLISIISLNITIIFSIYCYLRKHYIRQVKNLSKKINEIKYNEKKYYRLESKIKKDKKIFKKFFKNLKNCHRLDILKTKLQYKKEIFYIVKKLNKEIFDLNTQNQKKSEILACMQFNNS